MIKIVSLFISMLLLVIMSPFENGNKNPVSVTAEMPSYVKPGEDFEIKLKVKTHGIGGFARLQHYLPAGFTAESIETEGADFIFDEESARFIWTNIPAYSEFTVSYRVHVNSSISGRKIINGVFIYLNDEKTEKLALKPLEIVVGSEISASIPVIQRKLTSISPETGVYRVSLTIQPNNQRAAAKFIDEIPQGFIAEAEHNHENTFDFRDGKATFNWTRMPADSSFMISYIVRSNKPASPPEIQGVLVYEEETPLPLTAPSSPATAFNNPENETAKQSAAKESKAVEQIRKAVIANEEQNATAMKSVTASAGKNIDAASAISNTQTFTANGLSYRVQICATQKSPARDSRFFEDKYSVAPPIDLTYHEGWRKYLIGSFNSYAEAKAFSIETRKKVTDAFVVAYENGIRIPVGDANKRSRLNQ